MMTPAPALSASPAIVASWSVAPSTESTTSTATSAFSIARRAMTTATPSTWPARATRPGRRMPAVSRILNVRFCHLSTASTVSRVVPGMSLTIARSSFSNRLSKDDLPTFGRPTIATRVSRSFTGSGASRVPSGNRATISSSRSPTPWPCSAAISTIGSKPRL